MQREDEQGTLASEAQSAYFWTVHRRQVLLIGIVIGLAVFLAWLPSATRASWWAALRAERELEGMLLVFTLIVLSLLWSVGQRLDIWIFRLFNFRGHHPLWLDRVMWLATQVGSMGIALAVAGALFASGNRRLAAAVALGTLTLLLVVEILKALTDRVRPFRVMEGARIIGRRNPGRSFPSGHAAQTFFLAALLANAFHLGALATFALYSVAALVGFTRVYVGVHYPRDVLGGAVLGSVWGVLATLVDPRLGLPQ